MNPLACFQVAFGDIPPLRNDKCDAAAALRKLRGFIGRSQLAALRDCCKGEEKQFFFDKLVDLAAFVESMPKTYEQDGMGEDAIVSLHYFKGGCDWFITERDKCKEQEQAFGWADLGDPDCAELGYISIVELVSLNVELDLYWTPITLKQMKEKKYERN